jgi:RimJ/RimL family protein N-acetyltransferase
MMEELFLRKVTEADIEEVFALSNEDEVRRYSLHKEKITWEEHVRWFGNVLKDRNHLFYVVTDQSQRFLGQIRYRIEENQAVVSISLAEWIRGKGLSSFLLQESMKKLYEERKDVKRIVAYVSEENAASSKLFQKSGFSLVDRQKDFLQYIYTGRSEGV